MEQLPTRYNGNITRINICGTIFQCSSETLNTFKDSKLATLDKQKNNYDSELNEYYFDRDPVMLSSILDAYRKKAIHFPKHICGTSFREELEFWGLCSSNVSPCCWEALYKNEIDISNMNMLTENMRCNTNLCLEAHGSWRKKLWLFIDEPSSSVAACIWGLFISLLIIVSTLTMALTTLPMFTVTFKESEKGVVMAISDLLGMDNSTSTLLVKMKPHPYLAYTDVCCHLLLTMELLTGFLVCPRKKQYICTYIRSTVILGYISFCIAFTMEVNVEKLTSVPSVCIYVVFKILSILQIARLFYLTKRMPAFRIMGLTIVSSFTELKVIFLMLGILMFIFGFMMFVAEILHGSKIENVFIAMFWALITLTTVGYGDYYPDTVAGHVIAGACAVCGVLVLALPIGVISLSFYTFYNYQTYATTHIERYGIKIISGNTKY